MINYVQKNYDNTDILIPTRFSEGFIISDDDFNYLNNLYKFKPVKSTLCFYDKKYQKTVAYIDKNLFTKEAELYFNKNWLAYECIVTKSPKLLQILERYPENLDKYKQVKIILAKIAEKDAKYIAKGDHIKSYINYFDEKDDIDIDGLDNFEVNTTIIREML